MNLNDHPTIEQLRDLIKQADDRAGHHLLWVSKSGEVVLSRMPAGSNPARFQVDHPEMQLRYEMFLAGNEYMGPEAATDEEYVSQLFDSLLEEWAKPNGNADVVSLDSVFDRTDGASEQNGQAVLSVGSVQSENRKTQDQDRTEKQNGRPGMSPAVEQAYEAFHVALPELLRQHSGQWVAFSGNQQIGLGKTKTELFQRCLRQGLQRGEFFVHCIEPESDDEIE